MYDLVRKKKFPEPPNAWNQKQITSVRNLMKEYERVFFEYPKTRTKMLWKIILEDNNTVLLWQLAIMEDDSRMERYVSTISNLDSTIRHIDDFQPWLPAKIVEKLSNLEQNVSTFFQSLKRWSNRRGMKEIEATTKVVSVDQWNTCKTAEKLLKTIRTFGIELSAVTLDERIHREIIAHILGRESSKHVSEDKN
jgi:hypothetical protein